MDVEIRIASSKDLITIQVFDDKPMTYTEVGDMLIQVAEDFKKQDTQHSIKQEDTVEKKEEIKDPESKEMGQPETGSLLTKPCGAV